MGICGLRKMPIQSPCGVPGSGPVAVSMTLYPPRVQSSNTALGGIRRLVLQSSLRPYGRSTATEEGDNSPPTPTAKEAPKAQPPSTASEA
jgi:hypothetical protein